MKIKILFNQQTIFKITAIIILILNLAAFFYLYKFLKKNVYDALFFEFSQAYSLPIKKDDDINIVKFKAIIEKLEKKQTVRELKGLKNIFY